MTSPITLASEPHRLSVRALGGLEKSRSGHEDVQEQLGQGGSLRSVLHPTKLNRSQVQRLFPLVCVSPNLGPPPCFNLLMFHYVMAIIPHLPSHMGPGWACQHQQPCALTYLDPWPLLIMGRAPGPHSSIPAISLSVVVLFKQPLGLVNFWSCV